MAGIYCLEATDKSWIPEQVRDDSKSNQSGMTEMYRLSGMLIGRNLLLRSYRQELDPGTGPG
ncbi:protein of unknown function [Shewanella benthica]|uniref:Uncharacterized protein n=1 Tax=Shewanella benthica TaxID=43661 RepID=A0A330M3Q0_9GAMM|nr:protein of unknown function [Shewanella benthica]